MEYQYHVSINKADFYRLKKILENISTALYLYLKLYLFALDGSRYTTAAGNTVRLGYEAFYYGLIISNGKIWYEEIAGGKISFGITMVRTALREAYPVEPIQSSGHGSPPVVFVALAMP